MSPERSFIQYQPAAVEHERVQIALVHVDIACHARLYTEYSPAELECLRDILRDSFHTIAEHRGGKLFSWDGNCGAFMFLVEGREAYDNCALAAIQMLEMMPSINQDARASEDIPCPVEARISCDAGVVAYAAEPPNSPADFARELAKRGPDVSVGNRVTVTGRVHANLSTPLNNRFIKWKYSPELRDELYRTAPLHDTPQTGESFSTTLRRDQPAVSAVDKAPALLPEPNRHSGARRPRGRWYAVAIALVALVLVGFLIIRGIPHAPPEPDMAWEEEVQSSEWIAWRKQVHEKLSATPLTEETLAAALRLKRPVVRMPPAAALRHDEAVADVLLSYPGVRAMLRRRFGIAKQFLGTGFSNPVNGADYESASVHEYLIRNLPEIHDRVWARQLQSSKMVQILDRTVKDFVQDAMKQDETKPELKRRMVAHAEAGDRGSVLIRFAIFDRKWYKGTLGRPESERVFASDLTEVWNLKVKDAADRSGYTFNGGDGDTFFIWLFMPVNKDEAVLATWGEVLEHLPEWLEQAQERGP